ncbi:MAG: DAK2 domain-containing protein [Candidatus Cloacimonetes bacterium]|nr:DAK2 domain-containing protein [Candidatus Cloacimonadota bacterium]
MNSVAEAALSGARGNSGIIFAQYLHGLSLELPEKGSITVKHFAESAQKAVSHLYSSLMNPVEGTMLTVIREWAENLVQQSQQTTDFLHALSESLSAAHRSLKETPSKLKVLAEAGVVDAGASGFVHFLEGIMDYIHKGSLRVRETILPAIESTDSSDTHSTAPGEYRYCTEAILSGFSCSTNMVKGLLSPLGDSLILAGGSEMLHIHIHTNDPEKVFGELFRLGDVSRGKVDDMLRQYQMSNEDKLPHRHCHRQCFGYPPPEILDAIGSCRSPLASTLAREAIWINSISVQPDFTACSGKTPSIPSAASPHR